MRLLSQQIPLAKKISDKWKKWNNLAIELELINHF